MMSRAMRCLIAASALTLGLPRRAHAETRDPAAADALFQQGREAMKKGDLALACTKFAESERLDPAAGTLLNLADCEEKAGKLASALAHLRGALDLMPANDERVALARARIASLDRRVPRLTIGLGPNAPRGTHVKRGDMELGEASIGTALPMDPGTIVVIASAPGRHPRRFELSIAAGQSKTLTVEPGDADLDAAGGSRTPPPPTVPPTAAPSEESAAAESWPSRNVVGWTLVGAGAVGMGVGIAALGRRQSELDAASHRCPDDPTTGRAACTTSESGSAAENATAFHDDLSAATRWKTVAAVGFVTGGAAAIGGVVLLITGPSAEKTGLRVQPAFAGNAPSGVTLSGAW